MHHSTIAKHQLTVNDLMLDNTEVSITDCIRDNICHITKQKPVLHTPKTMKLKTKNETFIRNTT